jgi:hypothetical protein
MAGRRTLQVLVMLGGLIAWALQFTLIYGVTSTLCGRGWADKTLFGGGVVPATILLSTLAAFAIAAAMLLLSLKEYRSLQHGTASAVDTFMNQAAILISGLSLVVIIWHGVPALILPACA